MGYNVVLIFDVIDYPISFISAYSSESEPTIPVQSEPLELSCFVYFEKGSQTWNCLLR